MYLTQSCLCLQLLPVHTLRLGVELDSFDGHHYISSVVPGGPVNNHGVLRPEDELLEVKTSTQLLLELRFYGRHQLVATKQATQL